MRTMRGLGWLLPGHALADTGGLRRALAAEQQPALSWLWRLLHGHTNTHNSTTSDTLCQHGTSPLSTPPGLGATPGRSSAGPADGRACGGHPDTCPPPSATAHVSPGSQPAATSAGLASIPPSLPSSTAAPSPWLPHQREGEHAWHVEEPGPGLGHKQQQQQQQQQQRRGCSGGGYWAGEDASTTGHQRIHAPPSWRHGSLHGSYHPAAGAPGMLPTPPPHSTAHEAEQTHGSLRPVGSLALKSTTTAAAAAATAFAFTPTLAASASPLPLPTSPGPTSLPAPLLLDPTLPLDAFSPSEGGGLHAVLLSAVQQMAGLYELVHTYSGLPWAVSISLTTVALRFALLPISLRQARIIRTNYSIYKEAVALADHKIAEEQQQQEAQQQQQQQQRLSSMQGAAGNGKEAEAGAEAASRDAGLGHETTVAVLEARLRRSQAVLREYGVLRERCGAPHPVWILINPLVQIPVFVAASASLGIMCRMPWPGLTTEGALWFPDLTLPAYVMDTGDMPYGHAGFVLPLLVYGMTMTSLRLGVGAAGLRQRQEAQQMGALGPLGPAGTSSGVADTPLGAFLRALPPLLYALTTLNLYFKIQLPHGVLVHWAGSAGFTLGLQLALRHPVLREALGMNRTAAANPTEPSPSPTSADSGAGAGAAGSGAAPARWADLPTELVHRVAETSDPNVLVIMGAQLSARQHYAGALHCFRKAVLLKPSHVRAHYSMGQVYSLTGAWPDAELSYRAAAELSPEGPERGQALYCVASALHAQGKLDEAVQAYGEAAAHWQGQAVIAYGRANALAAAGRRREALAAVAEAEALDGAMAGKPFAAALARLRKALGGDEGQGEGQEEAGRGEGMPAAAGAGAKA